MIETKQVIAFTADELEAIGYTNPLGWHKMRGVNLTPGERDALASAVKKLQRANLQAQIDRAERRVDVWV